jgi:diguanylate cyclase (GGDEF)-like protein
MLAIHKDNEGTYFSFDKDLPALARLSNAPRYGMWGALMIENGAVGGMMNDPFQHGQAAAVIALNIISGTSVSSIKIQRKATYTPVFDYKQLQRFNIELDRLPLDSKVINKPISLYAQHSELINGIVVIFIFLNVVISLLLINIRQRRVAQHKLKQFNLKLESKVKQRTKDLLARNDELEAVSQRMEKMANTDLLTGLSNRRAAKREVEAFIKRFNIDFQPLTLGILDVDYFKKINDSFGHQIGDEVLCELANTLTTTLRPSDRVYRWGGEEFLIALPNAELETAYAVCQRLKSKISQFQVADVGVVTVSIGLANFKTNNTFDHIIQHADSALYDAKNQGRDRVVMAR